jgi:GNAT superfamily N-acetyltransferase
MSADAAELSAVAAATFPLACPPGMAKADIDAFVAMNLSPAKFAAYLADPSSVILVARTGTDAPDSAQGPRGIVAYALAHLREPADGVIGALLPATPSAELSKFYALPGAHGSGLAAALMAAVKEAATRRGARAMWLGVNQENIRAQRFYAKSDFKIAGPRTFMVGGQQNQDHVMTCILPAQGTDYVPGDVANPDQPSREGR